MPLLPVRQGSGRAAKQLTHAIRQLERRELVAACQMCPVWWAGNQGQACEDAGMDSSASPVHFSAASDGSTTPEVR
jgi:hypothetical protein